MDVYNVTPTQLYCPNCGYKVTGYNDRNAVLRRTCPKCRVAIKLTITDYKDGVIYLEKDEASYMFVAIGGDTLYDAQEKEFFYRRDGA